MLIIGLNWYSSQKICLKRTYIVLPCLTIQETVLDVMCVFQGENYNVWKGLLVGDGYVSIQVLTQGLIN